MALRRYFMAEDDEAIHWSDYVWAAGGYGVPIVIAVFAALSVY